MLMAAALFLVLVAACAGLEPAASGAGAPTPTAIVVDDAASAMAAIRTRSPLFDGIERRNRDLLGQGSWWDAEPVDGGWRVTVEVGWGDCQAGCIERHDWTWTVDEHGRSAFGGESGSPLTDAVLAGLQDASRAQGIGGRATAGPTCPVERPNDPACAPRLVANATMLVTNAAGAEVARFTTDGSGLFRIALAPGEYGVEASPVEGLMGTPGPATIEIQEGSETWLDLDYDTGIR